ncbi:hypothetical protein ACFXTI_040222 [Malus domestica]
MDLQFTVPHSIGVSYGSSVPDSSSYFGSSQGPVPATTASLTESPHPPSPQATPVISLPPTNTHPMITRSKAGIFKPKVYAATKHPIPSDLDFVPNTYLQASKHAHWRSAMQDEFNALQSTGMWTLIPQSSSYNVVGCKWVFRIKKKPDGTVERFKARLVAKVYHQ